MDPHPWFHVLDLYVLLFQCLGLALWNFHVPFPQAFIGFSWNHFISYVLEPTGQYAYLVEAWSTKFVILASVVPLGFSIAFLFCFCGHRWKWAGPLAVPCALLLAIILALAGTGVVDPFSLWVLPFVGLSVFVAIIFVQLRKAPPPSPLVRIASTRRDRSSPGHGRNGRRHPSSPVIYYSAGNASVSPISFDRQQSNTSSTADPRHIMSMPVNVSAAGGINGELTSVAAPPSRSRTDDLWFLVSWRLALGMVFFVLVGILVAKNPLLLRNGPSPRCPAMIVTFLSLLALGLIINGLLHIHPKSMALLQRMSQYRQANGLRMVVVLAVAFYIPALETTFSVFDCREVSCPAGKRLVDPIDRNIDTPFAGSLADSACLACNFQIDAYDGYCTEALAASLCSSDKPEARVENHWEVRCELLRGYLWPAACLTLLAFGLGLPFMFNKIIVHTHARMMLRFPLHDHFQDEEARWEAILSSSTSLPLAFVRGYRYACRKWIVVSLVQRLLLITCCGFLADFGEVLGISGCIVIYAISIILTIVYRPYTNDLHNILAVSVFYMLLITHIIMLVLHIFGEMYSPAWAMPAVLILDYVVPTAIVSYFLVRFFKGLPSVQSNESDPPTEVDPEHENLEPGMPLLADRVSAGEESVDNGNDTVLVAMAGGSFQSVTSSIGSVMRVGAGNRPLYERQKAADRRANSFITKYVLVYLQTTGIVYIAALALACIGAHNYMQRYKMVPLNANIRTEAFGGYTNWADFTKHCCCQDLPEDGKTQVQEKWVCSNGWVLARSRQAYGPEGKWESGLDIRGHCASTFTIGCSLVTNNDAWSASCNGTDINNSFALENLW